MAEIDISQKFISVGCNRTPNSASSSPVSGRFAFGAHNAIALWDPADETSQGIYATLKGHTDVVNAVLWVAAREKGNEIIVSGAVDKTVRIWKEKNGQFEPGQVLKEHSGSIHCLAVLPELLATGSSDGSLNIYTFNSTANEYSLSQTIRTSPVYPLTLSLHSTKDGTLLAIGGSSPHVHLFASPLDTLNFTKIASLKGHEDWIRGLDFTSHNSDTYLASASQDRYIRLWKITQSTTYTSTNDIDALLTAALGGESYPFVLNNHDYTVTFSALLPGHDDWVFTVNFHPCNPESLLSASADASLIIWRPEDTSGIWIPETRLGEVSSLKGATTAQGSTGGFWGGLWSRNGDAVFSWGKTGGWRAWWLEHGDGEGGESEGVKRWLQRNAVGGATRSVKDISWDEQGRWLVSVSLDQTTRMFGEWVRDGVRTWHEIARPQIHGYDLNTISTLKEWKFVSGADEKVIRVFQTSKSVADLICRLGGIKATDTQELPTVANLPVLGLSNKATEEDSPETFLDTLSTPPLEDHLSRYTLSPELDKIYSHPSEIISISSSHSGSLIATTCKSSSPEHAVLRIFETSTFTEIAVLPAHTLTVVKVAWSPNDEYLISVGRDRQWSMFDTKTWKLIKTVPKAHARIIWDASVAPLTFGNIFMTASRDKTVKIWDGGKGWECTCTIKFPESVTACAFLQDLVGDFGFAAVGLENGAVCLMGCEKGSGQWKILKAFDDRLTHSESVTGLAWRPCSRNGKWELASCGDDCSVRIYEVGISSKLTTNGS